MRISQATARSIAKQLTEKSRLAIDAIEKEYSELVTELYEADIPDEIRKTFTKWPSYFKMGQDIVFDGHGFSKQYVDTDKEVIFNHEDGPQLKLTTKTAAQIRAVKNRLDKAKKDYANLKKETETALRNLSTTKRISEAIPDAIPFLPPNSCGLPAIIVNFASLNKRLATQQDTATDKSQNVKQ